MWEPTNKDALPSTEEILCAKRAIIELEIMLKHEFELPEQTKERIYTLRKDLDERKAWIAPIRKVPVEILSKIFIFTSEVDELSPVTITEVCCFWRKVILSTPRAWSLIYADKLVTKIICTDGRWGRSTRSNGLQYFATFMQRSNPCMLHITMPPDEVYFDKKFDDFPHHPPQTTLVAIHRVRCLSVAGWHLFDVGPEVFPNLTKLTLLLGEPGISPGFFNRSRFPCLRYLDCTNCSLGNSPVGTTLFPRLQYLAVDIQFSGWIELVRRCADTLVALDVLESEGARPIPGAVISFPNLKSIAFGTRSNLTADLIWPFQATTPSLRSYGQMRQDGMQQSTVHHDVKNVTHVRIDQTMGLEEFVALRILQVELHGHNAPLHVIRTILHRLKENKDICPVLQTIRFSLSEEVYADSFKSLIPGFENTVRRARPDITLWFTEKSHIPLPGSFEEAKCGRNMPCVPKHDQFFHRSKLAWL